MKRVPPRQHPVFERAAPYQCEFCDIPGLYGPQPAPQSRPQQIIAEIEKLRDCGMTDTVYFVDDNFIGKPPRRRWICCRHLIEMAKEETAM